MRVGWTRRAAVGVISAVLVAGCTPLETDVRQLAGDELSGRDNGTEGSLRAQDYIIDRLDDFAVGYDTGRQGADAFRQPITAGTNLIGVIPGSDLADEYVVIGAHYDHVGSTCRTSDPADRICNGATDNAAGVALVLDVGRHLARRGGPRRTVVLALWDREEDGVRGSAAYVAAPPFPLDKTVAYVNVDIQGANLSPSLHATTFAIGAETGGERLRSAVDAAASGGALTTHRLSVIFGQGRSDHVRFVDARVPTVFFSDSTGPCYHTAQDDVDVVDFQKLEQETRTAFRLARDLANGDEAPAFVAGTPLASFDDAVALAAVADGLVKDIDRFTPEQQDTLRSSQAEVEAILAAGPEAFDPDDAANLIAGTATATVSLLRSGACEGFFRRG